MKDIEKILKDFANKWVKAENNWDTNYTKRRKEQLLKWVIEKIFLEHK